MDISIRAYVESKHRYIFMLSYCFRRPYEPIMEDKSYQKQHLPRPVMDRLRDMKTQMELLKKDCGKLMS